MTTEAIEQQLNAEIEALVSLKKGSVNNATDLTVLGIDSLKFVSLVLAIEQRFGVNLMKVGLKPDDTKTTRNMAKVVERALAGPKS